MDILTRYFKLNQLNTDVKTEVLAGFTTFVTMAYIIVVNPAILQAAGIPKGPSMVATILSAFFGTFLMGIYANRPFAIAPYMGENAFIAYTVVKVLGYNWQTAIGAIFISGVLFTVITVAGLRKWLANAIPTGLKFSFATGLGLFLAFIGMNECGLVRLGTPGAPVHVGDILSPSVLLSIFGFVLMGCLMIRKVKGALLISILAITGVSFIFGITKVPAKLVSLPPSIMPIFLKLDILGAMQWGFFAVILTVFVMDFVDTMGTLMGVAVKAGFLDEDKNLSHIEKPMLCDALATVIASLLGTTTTGTYIESAAGVEEGGRSGLTALVTSLLFLVALFFAPLFTSIPAHAYGPAMIIVGLLMIPSIRNVNFSDLTESIPAFSVIVFMSFTYNLGIGITTGFVLYPVFKLLSGRYKEIHPGLIVLSILSLLFYIFYPY